MRGKVRKFACTLVVTCMYYNDMNSKYAAYIAPALVPAHGARYIAGEDSKFARWVRTGAGGSWWLAVGGGIN